MVKNKAPLRAPNESFIEYISLRATRWIGSSASLVFHTALFIGSFLFYFLGFDFNRILLVVTTVVSLEAIYLSIFIQMSVNRQDMQLKEVSKDVEDIAEDVGEIQEDIEEIQEDVDEIQEDVEEIHEEDAEEEIEDDKKSAVDTALLERIETALKELGKEISEIKRKSGDS
jgi:methyl-accepting chemotaxis protein